MDFLKWVVKLMLFCFLSFVLSALAMAIGSGGDLKLLSRYAFVYALPMIILSWQIVYRVLPKHYPNTFGKNISDKSKLSEKSTNKLIWIIVPILIIGAYYIGNIDKSNDSSDSEVTKRTPVERKVIERTLSAKEYFNSAYEKGKNKDNYGAISDYTKAIELDPNYHQAYFNRGNAKFRLKDMSGAIADYTKAIELNPDNAKYYRSRGDASYSLNKLVTSAIEDYNKAIELDPDNARAYHVRGGLKGLFGNYYGGIADITKAIELNPDNARAYHDRGNLKESLGDLDGACLDWRKADNLGYIDIFYSERC